MWWPEEKPFENLKGKILVEVRGLVEGSDSVEFECADGTEYQMYHIQDCCESVYLADVLGSVDDLLGEEILKAEESWQDTTGIDCSESCSWTFYTLRTNKATVTLRWFGSSNGYYSERVDFVELSGRDPASSTVEG